MITNAQRGEFSAGKGAPSPLGWSNTWREHGQPAELRGEGFAPAARQAGGQDGHLGGPQQAARGPGIQISQICNLLLRLIKIGNSDFHMGDKKYFLL